MAPRARIDPKLARATRRLVKQGLTNAEIVRALQPLAAKYGKPVPSHESVRRIALPVRQALARPNPYVGEVIEKLVQGRMPDFYRVDSSLALQAPSGPREAISRVRRGGS